MKNNFMTAFQKQQYTNYLQNQLEKFSAFMLSQKKQNQRYKTIEEAIRHQGSFMDNLNSKIQFIEIGQRQNLSNCEKLFSKLQNLENIQSRVRRLQDRQRFDCDHELKKRAANSFTNSNQRQRQMGRLQATFCELSKKIKKIEEDLNRNKEVSFGVNQAKLYYRQEKELDRDALVDRTELKKLQKKMKKYFSKKFEDIDELLSKNHKRNSKSPNYRTPIEGTGKRQDQSLHSQRLLSQFKFDQSNITKGKSEISTVSRISKNDADQSRKNVASFKKKKSKRHNSKSKSKEKSISRSRSKSKQQKNNKSIKHSQYSYLSSQPSISKDLKLDKSFSKKSKKINKKSLKNISLQKSCHSSFSHTHDKCKKKPQEPSIKILDKSKHKNEASISAKRKAKKMI